MATAKEIPVEKLKPFNLRPVIPFRVAFLKESIKNKGYDPACPLVVQPDNDGYLVVNGCHRLQALKELGIERVPVVEYPKDEDPIKLALTTQENSESIQPWDFIDRAFLVKKLYEQLGTQIKVAEKLGWSQPVVSFYLQIASLPEDVITVIRESVIKLQNNSVIKNYNDVIDNNLNECEKNEIKFKSVDDVWKITWFKHICSLPVDELKRQIVTKIAQDPTRWKEKDVASEVSKLKRRYELSCKLTKLLGEHEECKKELNEFLEAINKGLYDNHPEKALERAEAIIKAKQRTDLELMSDFGYSPQVFTIWNFAERDTRFGLEHPGNIPAGIIFNVLYYWTRQNDLVIDPMAGGGVTIDVCKVMKRRCIAFDVNPVRDDITKHDATKPWPVEKESADLVFIDPPYWKQKRGEYKGENNLADMTLEEFYNAVCTVFQNAHNVLKSGGVIAVIIGPTQENGVVYDHALVFANLLEQTGFKYINRIIVPYTTQQVSGFDVAQAQKSKFLLKLHRDLLVYRKEKV